MFGKVFKSVRRLQVLSLTTALLLSPIAFGQSEYFIVYVSEMTEMDSDTKGSYPKLASLLNQYRSQSPVAFVSGGGNLAPSTLSSLDMGSHIIDLLNSLEPAAMVVGKREFSFYEDQLSLRAYEAAFPFVTSNSIDTLTQGNLDGTVDQIVVELGDLQLGILGILPPNTLEEYNVKRMVLAENPVELIRQKAEALRASGVDLIIMAYSCCYRDYLNRYAEFDELLASGVLDLALGKDEHLLLTDNPEMMKHPNHIWIAKGDEVAIVRIHKDDHNRFSFIVSMDSMNSYEADATVLDQVDDYNRRLDSLLSEPLGRLNTDFSTLLPNTRTQENPFGNFIADVLRNHANADIAFFNSGFIRAERNYVAPLELTRRDILAELPFRDHVVLLEVTGAQLLAAMENSLSQIEDMKGRYLQVSGMEVVYDSSQDPGKRVIALNVRGQAVQDNQIYRLATRQFIANGGDGFDMFIGVKPIVYEGQMTRLVSDLVIDAIQVAKSIAPKIEGRLQDVAQVERP
ncbi:bifunctional metallophosphatase/5'-nucleotidase [Nitrincola nitratireducens]|uniref:Trifunctional nucleotide phosphoesterase protein YfkN n=1 Tax=Nitrincola nitratireducens TaxID=1229521 RepID=W9VK91_9GAMM|nr:5'-nucleotidase C-terminal domain-containing protein [Nitrincola nitratireducens]EXJ10965.1 Trifunctional nucleotide phosphoesterase protein YfkN precursor [Nitrincola nitratireducens]